MNWDLSASNFGIYEKARAKFYFRGARYDVSDDTLEEIKSKGYYVLIIEKGGSSKLVEKQADKAGIALCDTGGFFADNVKKLSDMASKTKGNTVMITDSDFSGYLMASKLPNIPRIGVNLETLRILGVPLSQVKEELKKPKNTEEPQHKEALDRAIKEEGFKIPDEDYEFLNEGKYGSRFEIDNVIAYTGAGPFWNFIIGEYTKLFPTADATRSVNVPTQVTPEPLKMLNDLIERRNIGILKKDVEREKKRLSKKKGIFEDIEKEENNISESFRKKEEKSDKLKPLLDKILAIVSEEEEGERG